MKYHEREAVAYCRICGELFRPSLNDLLIGRRFICPRWRLDFSHIGVVVNKTDLSVLDWLCLQGFIVCYSARGGLMGRVLRCLGRRLTRLKRLIGKLPYVRNDIAATSLLAWFILLVAALTCLANLRGSLANCFASVIAGAYIDDTILYNTSVAFVTQQPRLPLRTVILMGIAFLELSLAFAVLYLALVAGQMKPALDWLTAPYFSLVTIVTLGYGDFAPCSGLARILVMGEIVVGLYFLSILFAVMVGWANQSSTLPTLCEILDESQKLGKNMAYSAELMKCG